MANVLMCACSMLSSVTREVLQAGSVARSWCWRTPNWAVRPRPGNCRCRALGEQRDALGPGRRVLRGPPRPGARRPAGTHSVHRRVFDFAAEELRRDAAAAGLTKMSFNQRKRRFYSPAVELKARRDIPLPPIDGARSDIESEPGTRVTQQVQYLCGTLQMLHHDTPSVSTASTHNARSPNRFRNTGASCHHPPAANHVRKWSIPAPQWDADVTSWRNRSKASVTPSGSSQANCDGPRAVLPAAAR